VGCVKDFADKAFAGVVLRMRLAGVDDLQAADGLGNCGQTFGIVEEQAGTLIGGDATGKTEREHVFAQLDAGAASDLCDELLLTGLMDS
jgi:hypothetical protein